MINRIDMDDERVIITVECTQCHKEFSLTVYPWDWKDYIDNKKLIQDCFPYIDAPHRELLISGICPECWTRMFYLDDEE